MAVPFGPEWITLYAGIIDAAQLETALAACLAACGLIALGLISVWIPEAAAQKRGGKLMLVYAVGNHPYSPVPYVYRGR